MSSGHFQYDDLEKDALFQGDILERTDSLVSVLQALYPYPHENPKKYSYFMVLTQSCDLARGNGRSPKAEHITLAAVRPLQLFLEQEILKLQKFPVFQKIGICIAEKRTGFLQRVERLISNEMHPYFYLHPTEKTPFMEPMIANLRITFPFRTRDHFDVCLNAKKAQLEPEFQAKVGWLTTLVFGRVGTRDFDPDVRHALASEYVNGVPGIEWLKSKVLQEQARKLKLTGRFSELTEDELEQIVDGVEEQPRLEAIADVIVCLAKEIWPDADDPLIEF